MSKSEATRAAILSAGVHLAKTGLHLVTARRAAILADCHHSNVGYYFKTNDAFLNAVAHQAVADGEALVIGRLILERHAVVSSMARGERLRWLAEAAN